MENAATAASDIYESFKTLISQDLSADEADRARSEVIRWIESRIASIESANPDARRDVIENGIPKEIRATFEDLDPRERFELAATSYDRWRLLELSGKAFSRAQAYLEDQSDANAMKSDAEADLAEIQIIEVRFSDNYAYAYDFTRTAASEGKLDAIYVIKGGSRATSNRLGRIILRNRQA